MDKATDAVTYTSPHPRWRVDVALAASCLLRVLAVKRFGFRFVRILFVAALAYAAYGYLAPRGFAWVLGPIAGSVLLMLLGIEMLRRRRRGAGMPAQWEEALLDETKRPAAIAALRARLSKAGSGVDSARLRVALAELLDVGGNSDEATDVLSDIEETALPDIDGAVVRHARAEIALRRGAIEAAFEALSSRPLTCGDAELDVRLDLLAAQIEIERGGAESALKIATRLAGSAGKDVDLARDANIVRACALDALERRDEALALLKAINKELRAVISVLGSPRVRALIATLDLASAAK